MSSQRRGDAKFNRFNTLDIIIKKQNLEFVFVIPTQEESQNIFTNVIPPASE